MKKKLWLVPGLCLLLATTACTWGESRSDEGRQNAQAEASTTGVGQGRELLPSKTQDDTFVAPGVHEEVHVTGSRILRRDNAAMPGGNFPVAETAGLRWSAPGLENRE